MSPSHPSLSSGIEVQEQRNPDTDTKGQFEGHIEDVSEFHKPQPPEGIYISPEEIQAQFDLLRDLSPDQMIALNNRVLKKIDWHTMPCVTLMFLMKYVLLSDVSMVPSN